ncbi:NAD(P)-binding protein [Durotheca rogersii]|uniref:NAD(P)-binding protein n=1 Tax=Durotheca rogersii TaxID=419775 RepID=UPI00221FEC01|nr:NAD(P)-binding protein [Durotheca rogersii]KAI5865957.1 NAD(P)-binding protein [Durotheca rogersii]
MPFPYKTVLMIGATSGIGLALAERMIENGVFVIGVGRRKERLDAFVAKHGADKAATSQLDITELDKIAGWCKDERGETKLTREARPRLSISITAQHPGIDAVFLNAGVQCMLDFTRPEAIDAGRVRAELATNYGAAVELAAGLLPQLRGVGPRPAALATVTSGAALVPMARGGNYSASKAALHALTWSVRAQLARDPAWAHLRVLEILPPAVRTELHARQPELVAAGQADIGMPLPDFVDELWAALDAPGDHPPDEIPVGPVARYFDAVEAPRRAVFARMAGLVQVPRGPEDLRLREGPDGAWAWQSAKTPGSQ